MRNPNFRKEFGKRWLKSQSDKRTAKKAADEKDKNKSKQASDKQPKTKASPASPKEGIEEIIRKEIVKILQQTIQEKTKRAGHQVVGRPVPDDRIKPLEEDDGDCQGDECPEDSGDGVTFGEAVDDDSDNESNESENLDIQESRRNFSTPEEQTILYHNRFGKRNADLFEKLTKKWTK